jgi:hypothetical protein
MQIHPRYFKVTEARLEFHKELLKAEEKHDLTIDKILEPLLAIAVETNKVEDLKDRKAPDLDEVGMGIYRALIAQEKLHELTPAESIKILLEIANTNNQYAIQMDRHPDDPEKKSDRA